LINKKYRYAPDGLFTGKEQAVVFYLCFDIIHLSAILQHIQQQRTQATGRSD
jgi:hypothetical protein